MQPIRETGSDLPEPDSDSAEHSRRVARHIRDLIERAGGSISFAEFMQHALYAPGLGYYVAGSRKFGPGGDFVTAPEISPLFGRVLARQCAEVLAGLDAGDILEPGAGSGALAASILAKLAELEALPDRYLILEVSADLRERQQAYLQQNIPDLANRVSWLSELPQRFSGVIVANEVADALPVERFRRAGNQLMQARVVIQDDRFDWQYSPAPELLSAEVSRIEDELGGPLPEGYESEVSPGVRNWITDLSACLQDGFLFLFDYGVTRREYYAPDRGEGWLRCHFRHHAHDDPLILPGIQDLTSWIDFSAVAEAATGSGLTVAGYVTQAHFLMYGGLEDELSDFLSLSVEEQVDLSRQVKLLTLPAEMGENFKCIGLCRGDVGGPAAFSDGDRAHLL